MKIIITEEQLNNISNEFLKNSLFKYWDIQKKKGNEPKLDEIVYDIAGVKKYTSGDSVLVRPIWYEYNGGYEKLFSELKEKTKGKRFNIKGDNNLNIVVHVDYVTSYGVSNSGGMVDLIVSIDGGTMYYEFYSEDSNEPEIVNNADIFEVYNDLEYDRADLTQFVKDTVEDYFDKKFEYLGIPLYVEVNW
jgi:hypothetical protein